MAAVSIRRNKLESYVCSANEAIRFKLVRSEKDVHDENCVFHPEFTHQFFGDNESIFGYRDLNINLYYMAGSLICYLGQKYSEKIDPKKFDGVEADSILPKIGEKLQRGYLTNLDEFISSISSNYKFKPFGEKLHEFSNNESTYEVYKADIFVPGFKEYYERLQTFVLWYIDAASYIDIDDDKWNFYLVFEKYEEDDRQMNAVVGLGTVYHYYAYPNLIRPRISQMLILPPFQKKGIGVELLQSIYNQYVKDPNVLDITVEDPSEEFTRLRDFVDAKNCLTLKSFSPDFLHAGFCDAMAAEAQRELKLNKKQSRRIYEILRLRVTKTTNPDQYRGYRLDIKNRLNLPYQKQQSDLAKLQKTLRPEELKAAMNCTTKDQRIEQLERQYQEVENEYQNILQRLERDLTSS